jgi:hypothetical protein
MTTSTGFRAYIHSSDGLTVELGYNDLFSAFLKRLLNQLFELVLGSWKGLPILGCFFVVLGLSYPVGILYLKAAEL